MCIKQFSSFFAYLERVKTPFDAQTRKGCIQERYISTNTSIFPINIPNTMVNGEKDGASSSTDQDTDHVEALAPRLFFYAQRNIYQTSAVVGAMLDKHADIGRGHDPGAEFT